jgi:hypothetical protein
MERPEVYEAGNLVPEFKPSLLRPWKWQWVCSNITYLLRFLNFPCNLFSSYFAIEGNMHFLYLKSKCKMSV